LPAKLTEEKFLAPLCVLRKMACNGSVKHATPVLFRGSQVQEISECSYTHTPAIEGGGPVYRPDEIAAALC